MKSPSDNWAPQSTDDERRQARERYRRDYYAPKVEQRHQTVREACGVVALCVMIGAFVSPNPGRWNRQPEVVALCVMIGAFVAALIWMWRA
jgi:hypothetical protein